MPGTKKVYVQQLSTRVGNEAARRGQDFMEKRLRVRGLGRISAKMDEGVWGRIYLWK